MASEGKRGQTGDIEDTDFGVYFSTCELGRYKFILFFQRDHAWSVNRGHVNGRRPSFISKGENYAIWDKQQFPGEVHGVVLCIALVFLSFLRFLLYSVDWTSVGHSLRCGSLGLETSTLNSFVDADRRFTDPSIYDKTLWPQHRLRPPNFGLL